MNDVGAAPSTAPADARQVYARLVRYAKPHWRAFGFAIFGTSLFAATNLGFTWFLKIGLIAVLIILIGMALFLL